MVFDNLRYKVTKQHPFRINHQEGNDYNNFIIKLKMLNNNTNDISDKKYPCVMKIEEKLPPKNRKNQIQHKVTMESILTK